MEEDVFIVSGSLLSLSLLPDGTAGSDELIVSIAGDELVIPITIHASSPDQIDITFEDPVTHSGVTTLQGDIIVRDDR